TSFTIYGQPPLAGHGYDALYRTATNDYLQTLGVTLLDGRLFERTDDARAPRVLVINETMAREFWPGRSAVGQKMTIGGSEMPRTVVGVVKDVRERGYELAMKPGVYVPLPQQPRAQPDSLIVRTTGDPLALVGDIRRIIAAVDPLQPVSAIRTMDE